MPSASSTAVPGYSVLPVQLPPTPSFPNPAAHYFYVRPHEPRIPDPDSSRSLFIVNIPETSTELHFRNLFSNQLSSGRIERVVFHNPSSTKSTLPNPSNPDSDNSKISKKRKRATVGELQSELDSVTFPALWDRQLQPGGSHVLVIFVDRPSMEASFKAVKKAAKLSTKIIWGEGIGDKLAPLGSQRYENHKRLQYPSQSELLQVVNDYMSVFSRLEEAQAYEDSKREQTVDEDGFITVVRGPKVSEAREQELKELAKKQKESNKGLEDFYRFQMREKRKQREGQLLRKFEDDKKKVEEMKRRRKRIMVC